MNGVCRLCLRERPLEKSHIFPEFLHRHMSDQKGRAVEVNVSKGRDAIRQTSEWQYLLCGKCEDRFQTYETYFARIWYKHPVIPDRCSEQSFLIQGLDYTLFKLFHLSILWRAAASDRETFEPVQLGPHKERLRKLLLRGEPGPVTRYSIFATAVLNDDNALFHEVLLSYSQSHVGGHHYYMGIYAGFEWTITVSSHHDDGFAPVHLTRTGTMLVPCRKLVELSTFHVPYVTYRRNKGARTPEGSAFYEGPAVK
jgi:hypothetical protein